MLISALPDLFVEINSRFEIVQLHIPEDFPWVSKKASEFLGKKIWEVLSQKDAEEANSIIEDTLKSSKPHIVNHSRKIEEALRYYEIRGVSTEGRTTVFFVRDRTQDEQAKIKLQETLKELHQTNNRLQKFAYYASHDLQEPLRGMHGPAQILLDTLGEKITAEERRWIEHIRNNAIRLQTMVKDMLMFSRAGTDEGEPTLFDGSKAVYEVIDLFETRISELNAEIVVSNLPHIFYDRTKFQAIIGNLLSNALKFRRPGVRPIVHIRGDNTLDGFVKIRVEDNGIGIPEAESKKIFQPGFRLHHSQEYPGNGLGLSSVAMILHKCGGSLGLRSKLGEGTEFVLTLPGGVPHVQD